ncbi:hypothetical protein DL96DRAFT_1554360 [Flagelloscypha sp. PMI_526]|nr:hypothetical protein DL96DRAFT_1554360 [Flagelloscypha sp. PMI_526]
MAYPRRHTEPFLAGAASFAQAVRTRRPTLVADPKSPTEHILSTSDTTGSPSIIFTIQSQALSADSVPIFHEGDVIRGTVQVNTTRVKALQKVNVAILGSIITGHSDKDLCFLQRKANLWPDRPSSSTTSDSETLNEVPDACTWPFSISIPPQGIVKGKPYELPEAFAEKIWPVRVKYEISLVWKTKGRFKTGQRHRLTSPFLFFPQTTCPPLTLLHERAYETRTIMPGPEENASGWESLPPRSIKVHVPGEQSSHITSTLYISKPTTFARGTALPLRLTFENPDDEVLDLLEIPSSITVVLQRKVSYLIRSTAMQPTGGGRIRHVDDVGTASWREIPCKRTGAKGYYGEISLSPHLNLTSEVDHFSIQYDVIMRPFSTTSAALDEIPLSAQNLVTSPVKIVALPALGQARPRSLVVPAYASSGPTEHQNQQRAREEFDTYARNFSPGFGGSFV